MRHGTSSRRQRNNRGGGGRRGNQNRMQVYDSNGPDVRIRGTAHQVCEKYLALAKDSASAGDEILAESYRQHAEHYQRLINEQAASSGSRNQKAEVEAPKEDAQTEGKKEDLSLPTSILGDSPKAEKAASTEERTEELSPAE